MRRAILTLLFLSSALFAEHPALKRLKYGPSWDYQTMLVNGEVIHHAFSTSGGSRVIFDRYKALKTVCQRYRRPFKVLDIGANNGFFTFSLLRDFPNSSGVMIDVTNRLSDLCTLNTQTNNVVYLKRRMTLKDIRALAEKEHFDVVLAFHVLHHVDHWREWVDTLLTLGDNVIIETPPIDDHYAPKERTNKLTTYLLHHPLGKQIGSFERGATQKYDHMLWFCVEPSSFHRQNKYLGIKPTTFFDFGGTFPSPEYVRNLSKKIEKEHGDTKWLLQGVDYLVP